MSTTVIAEVGSTHNGDLKLAKELVKIAYECGADAVKFQLLTDREVVGGNILLPWEWLPDLRHDKIEVFASVFSKEGILFLEKHKFKSIKFAYSQQELFKENQLYDFNMTYLSSGVNDIQYQPSLALCGNMINLFCIPCYPVLYDVNFDGIFPRFDGWSSHALGIRQELKAVEAGATTLECHFKGTWDSPCPDAKFAKSPKELTELCKKVK